MSAGWMAIQLIVTSLLPIVGHNRGQLTFYASFYETLTVRTLYSRVESSRKPINGVYYICLL